MFQRLQSAPQYRCGVSLGQRTGIEPSALLRLLECAVDPRYVAAEASRLLQSSGGFLDSDAVEEFGGGCLE